MKKFLTLAAAIGLTIGAYAQRSADIECLIVTPVTSASSPHIIKCGNTDTFKATVMFINHGPDSLKSGDTFYVSNPGAEAGFASGYIMNQSVLADDTFGINYSFGYPEIEHLNGTTTPYDDVVKADFASGTEYFAFFAFSHFATGNDIVDENDTNNLDAALVKVDCTTGLSNVNFKKTSLNVFPNPANSQISFTNEFAATTSANVRITDISGRIVKTMNLGKQNAGSKTYTIDIADLNNGMYFIELVTEGTRSISKFSKN